ncbi:MAG: DUF302 domain-containing protein [Myxococcota bacterium]|jgi:uncharacterized protein (DUF302 family)|nr:DUF302 domain-containing protein [Myxococcota bacterium]
MQSIDEPLRLSLTWPEAVAQVEAALAAEGFGIITRVDVSATFKQKLGLDFRPYVILGACNPGFAHRALSTAPEMGVMLPCNVVVEQHDASSSLVRFQQPSRMVSNDSPEHLRLLAEEVESRLSRAAAALVS